MPTHPFDAAGYAELFHRALHKRGARAHKDALTAAGDLLARTPPVRNLRNARLAPQFADLVIAAVRDRSEPGEDLLITPADIPPGIHDTGATGDPMAELDALTGLATVRQEIELAAAGVEAARLRRDAGQSATAEPARHMVFTGGPGTGEDGHRAAGRPHPRRAVLRAPRRGVPSPARRPPCRPDRAQDPRRRAERARRRAFHRRGALPHAERVGRRLRSPRRSAHW